MGKPRHRIHTPNPSARIWQKINGMNCPITANYNNSSATNRQMPMKRQSNPLVTIGKKPGLRFVVSAIGYAFTAPKVRPATIWRCTTPNTTSAGISVMMAIDDILPHSVPVEVTRAKSSAKAKGLVR